MAKNLMYAKEIKIAFANVSKLKEDMDNLFAKFRENWDQVSDTEKQIIEKFEERYDRELITRPRGRHWIGFDYFTPIVNGYKTLLKDFEFDLDKELEDVRDWFDMEELNECEERGMELRREYIVDCASFKKKIEKFKSELLEALNQVQVEKVQIAKPKKATVTVNAKAVKPKRVTTKQHPTSSDTILEKLKKTAQRVYATVKNTVNHFVKSVKTSIEDMIARAKRTVAAIMAE